MAEKALAASNQFEKGAEDYLDPNAASEFVKLSASVLAKLRMTGEGPRFFKFGRNVRYHAPDLVSWLAARATPHQSTSEYPKAPENWRKRKVFQRTGPHAAGRPARTREAPASDPPKEAPSRSRR